MIASTRVQTAADSTRARLCVLCAAGFLCPLTDNVYDVEFLAFKIRDAETGKVRPRGPPATLSSRTMIAGTAVMGTCRLQVYFEVAKPQPDGPGIDYSQLDDSCRFIQYQFPAEVLSLNNIGTTCAAPPLTSSRMPADPCRRGRAQAGVLRGERRGLQLPDDRAPLLQGSAAQELRLHLPVLVRPPALPRPVHTRCGA